MLNLKQAMSFPLPWAWWLALLSGAAGLAHQILWTRRMVDVLGANADTFAKVGGTFFVGLALGAWATTRPGLAGLGRAGWCRVRAGQVVEPLVRHPEGVAMMIGGSLPEPGPARSIPWPMRGWNGTPVGTSLACGPPGSSECRTASISGIRNAAVVRRFLHRCKAPTTPGSSS